MKLVIFVMIIGAFIKSNAEDGFLPPYITPCDYNSQFQECTEEQIKRSIPHFSKGIPEINISSSDPLYMDDIHIDGNGLTLTFTDVVMWGISNIKVVSFNFNLATEDFELVIVNNLTITAQYKMDGKILILPIRGEGNANIDLYNSQINMRAKLAHYEDKIGEHFKLISTNYNHEVDNVRFNFSNLFGGNKQLAEATLKFANENWKQIMDDLAPPIVKQVVKSNIKFINKFFSKVSISQIIKGYKKLI